MDDKWELYCDRITEVCLDHYSRPIPGPMELATRLMEMDGFPMHAPTHHYLVPAVLLTVCRAAQKLPRKVLERDLALALERAKSVPGGACGYFGCCGACVGVGIFWSILTDSSPLSGKSWAYGNRGTANALSAVAEVGGPRCCKRCTYLSLSSVLPQIREILGLNLPEETISCKFYPNNHECLRQKCPFYRGTPISIPTFCYPKKDVEHPCPCQDRPMEMTYKTGKLFWIKNPGDHIKKGESVAEIEVEKKTTEIQAAVSGTLLSRCYEDGDEVSGTAIIGYLKED